MKLPVQVNRSGNVPTARRRHNSRRLAFEGLEPRRVLSGNPVTGQFHAEAVGGVGVFVNSGQQIAGPALSNAAVVVGDLDGDADLDVFLSGDPNTVWLNNGQGHFTDTGQAVGDSESLDVALGDFDGDGDLDAFVGNRSEADRVWFNDGLGHFTDSGQALGDSQSVAVLLGDVDADGDLDAFVADGEAPGSNRLWLNDGQGYFHASDQGPTGGSSTTAAIGDLDGDGDLDILVMSSGSRTWLNDGHGRFSDSRTGVGANDCHSVALGDLDGDGDLDALVTNFSRRDDRVYLNDGQGGFTLVAWIPGSQRSLAVALGDVDGDGDLDAYIAGLEPAADKIWINDGSGRFTDSGQELGKGPTRDVALADLDGDGDLDAVSAHTALWPGLVWVNDGQGSFHNSGRDLGGGAKCDVGLGDVDGDGDEDAFLATAYANRVWLNDGRGRFDDGGQALGNAHSRCVALGDLDGDGDLDAFVGNQDVDDRVWLNEGNGSFTDSGQRLGNSDTDSLALGDLDGDGDLDALVGTFESTTVWLNDGQGRFEPGHSVRYLSGKAVALGDLDADGDLDAFVGTRSANLVLLNDGRGRFIDSGQELGGAWTHQVALGDLDGDGDLDAFAANHNADNEVWFNGGNGRFISGLQGFGELHTQAVALGDLDGDHDLDLVTGNTDHYGHGEPNRVWLNNGWGHFTDRGQRLGHEQTVALALGDLDADGDLDALVADLAQPASLWLNLGPLVVSTAVDEKDGDHSPGDLSLREALALAAELPGDDVIEFDAGLTGSTITLDPTLGQLNIDSNVYVRGPGPGQLTVDADGASRVVFVAHGVRASIGGLTITGGRSERWYGGGICSDGDLTVAHAVISGNSARDGGGIWSRGPLTIDNATISDNSVWEEGGGILCSGRARGTVTRVTMTRVTVSGNQASRGGGIYAGSVRLMIVDSTISGNHATKYGGGIDTEGDAQLTLAKSSVSRNSARQGGGISLTSDYRRPSLLSRVTISENSGKYAGGVFVRKGEHTFNNVTISANTSTDLAGGIIVISGRLTLTNSSIVGNSGAKIYGGIFTTSSQPPLLHNTIVAANSGADSARDVVGKFDRAGSHNLIGSIDGSTGLEGTGTLFGTADSPLDPMLGPLADNGGATLTHALLPGSPAIDAGSNDRAADAGLTKDQRGFDRFVDGDRDGTATVDVGAYEARPVMVSTPGLYDPLAGAFHLKNSNSAGPADAAFNFGPKWYRGWIPLAGDWDGDGFDTVGLYDPFRAVFHITNSNANPPDAADEIYRFGPIRPWWQPIAGDFDGDGIDTVGLYDPLGAGFHLKNSHTTGGGADVGFTFGPRNPGTWKAIVGDWDGDGVDSVGLYDSLRAGFHLKNVNARQPRGADAAFRFGPIRPWWRPVAGDFDGDGVDTVGLYDPLNAKFLLNNRNAPAPGGADVAFRFGPPSALPQGPVNATWQPIFGDWDGPVAAEALHSPAVDVQLASFVPWADSDASGRDRAADPTPAEIDTYFGRL